MFRRADLVLITKCDLLPYFDFSVDEAKAQLKKLNPNTQILEVSIKDGDAMRAVVAWLNDNLHHAAGEPQ